MRMRKYYIITNPNGVWVGVDQNSGGYPFETDYLQSVRIWNDKVEAESYCEKFWERGYTVRELKVSIA
jgi:hypothetical protein